MIDMKRFLLTVSCLLCAAVLALACYYLWGVSLWAPSQTEPAFSVRTQKREIQLHTPEGWQPFAIRGVDLGSGQPGSWSTDYAVDQETYLRWFGQMQEMGANVIRIYAIQSPDFYRALKAYNESAAAPLYLLQGVWVNDYAQNSHMDAFDTAFQQRLILDCKATVDALHGKRFILTNDAGSGSGLFLTDVSPWVLGYVIGSEWTDVTVAYTDEKYPGMEGFSGTYLYTAEDATPFEIMLARTGDALIAYESQRYGQQRLVSFANGRSTDPFCYPQEVTEFFRKCASIDAEHIRATDAFQAGLFASYSCYSYDLDYLSMMEPAQWHTLCDVSVSLEDCMGEEVNTYRAYLKLLCGHHTLPVVALEFGASSGRGLAQSNTATSLREGHFSEGEQGEAIVECWQDIMAAGWNGGCVFSWQDEWHKRTWNTLFAVDFSRTPYWLDMQSSDQHFGLLAFDPGRESVCVVDGDVSEWRDEDVTAIYPDGSSISLKYDEAYLYIRIYRPGYAFGSDTLYLPMDITPKTGSAVCPEYGLHFDRAADFLLRIHTAEDSVLMVQDRYHAIHANYESELTGRDAYISPPAKDSPCFETVLMAVKDTASQFRSQQTSLDGFETGLLRLGNADPEAADYDSLTDYAVDGENIELRIPWAMLNFLDPSRMQIHDDYYDGNYGVAPLRIKALFIGLGIEGETIQMAEFPLKGWGNEVRWHERLKPAYDALRICWTGGDGQ